MCRHTQKELALLQASKNVQLPGMMVWQAVKAGLADDKSVLMRSDWMMAKLKESYYQARQEDQRKNIVQKVMQRSTEFLSRIIAAVREQGGGTLSYVCPSLPPSPACASSGGSRRGTVTAPRAGRSSATGGARLVAARVQLEGPEQSHG